MKWFVLVAIVVLATACGGEERPAADDVTRVSGHGLAIELSPSWHADVSKPEARSAPLLRVATFPLLEPATDLGQAAQARLSERDILISVVDYGRIPDPARIPVPSPPISVSRSDVASFEGFREPVVTRSFRLQGHVLQLWVVFGAPARDELIVRANDALATLSVEPRWIGLGGLRVEVPDGWTGFAKDLDPGSEQAPTVVVANVPWRDDDHNFAHPRTTEPFERLRPDGMVIVATAGRYPIGKPDQDPAAPLRLSDGHFIADQYEGQPAPHVSTQLVSRRLGPRWVSVQVFFGRNDPTLGMRAQADAVLGSLELRDEG